MLREGSMQGEPWLTPESTAATEGEKRMGWQGVAGKVQAC